MDNTRFSDIMLEFLAISFHNILYHSSIYPSSVFEPRRKYNIVVYRSIHPEINQYIDLCLKTVEECFKCTHLSRVEFAITNTFEPLVKFVFDFDKNYQFDETVDAYLVQAEQNFRAFCLKIASMRSNIFMDLPEDCSFTIFLHTNESAAVALANKLELEDFPFLEVEGKHEGGNKIVPLRRFSVRNYNIDAYVEVT